MSEGLNRVMLLGNLGADPELRYTQSGQAILKLRLATTESYLDTNRVRQERTEWHSVVVWGKRGEALSRILNKGSRIFVEGGLRTSSYDDKDGNKRYRTEIVANDVILAGGAGGGARRGGEEQWGGGGGGAPPARRAPSGGGYGGPPSGGGYGGPPPSGSGGYGAPAGHGGASDGYGSPASSNDDYGAPPDDFGNDDDIPF